MLIYIYLHTYLSRSTTPVHQFLPPIPLHLPLHSSIAIYILNLYLSLYNYIPAVNPLPFQLYASHCSSSCPSIIYSSPVLLHKGVSRVYRIASTISTKTYPSIIPILLPIAHPIPHTIYVHLSRGAKGVENCIDTNSDQCPYEMNMAFKMSLTTLNDFCVHVGRCLKRCVIT